MNYARHFLIIALLTSRCVPVSETTNSTRPQINKKLLFQDHRYEANIRSDLLYPNRGFTQDVVQSSVIALNAGTRLILEFDELNTDYTDYSAKLIHCNHNWTKSNLSDLEFISEYNEFPLREYEFSRGIAVPYTRYRFEVPPVSVSGNYLLVVYRSSNRQDIVLTRRFVVFDSRTRITPTINVRTGAIGRFESHQIEFDVNYGSLQIMNPYNDLKVVVRQNQRWDNAITNLKPTQVRTDKSLLQYRHFGGENTFFATNEFRFVDIRSTSFRGQNIARVEKGANSIEAYAAIDKPRASIYSQYSDLNGNFFIENNDPGANFMEEDYVETRFYLEIPEITNPIYLIGGFNHWQRTAENTLTYDSDLKMYTTSILLKQGYYNYLYYVDEGNPNPYYLDGAFFEAENDYDIIAYFRRPGSFADEVVGYQSFSSRN